MDAELQSLIGAASRGNPSLRRVLDRLAEGMEASASGPSAESPTHDEVHAAIEPVRADVAAVSTVAAAAQADVAVRVTQDEHDAAITSVKETIAELDKSMDGKIDRVQRRLRALEATGE